MAALFRDAATPTADAEVIKGCIRSNKRMDSRRSLSLLTSAATVKGGGFLLYDGLAGKILSRDTLESETGEDGTQREPLHYEKLILKLMVTVYVQSPRTKVRI